MQKLLKEILPLINRLKNVFVGNNLGRTQVMVKNVVLSFFTKGSIAIIGLLLVPILLKLLSKEEFGIWQTLSSILGWLYFMDIGLSNGFKNLFTQALAEQKVKKAVQYLSTTYAIIILVSLLFILVFELINPFLNWSSILNFNGESLPNFNWVIQVVFVSFAFKLTLSILNTTLIANQQFSASTFIDLYGNLLVLLLFSIMLHWGIHSFFLIAFITSFSPLLIMLLASYYYFSWGSLKAYKPSFSFVDFSLSKDLFGKGLQFFFIQISFVLMFTANNIIVAQLFGPEKVAELSIVHKYYSIPLMGFIIVLGPFWSGFTEAFFNKDNQWVKLTIKRLFGVWLVFMVVIWGMFFYFDEIATFWLGKNIQETPKMVLFYAMFASINTFNSIFSYFLNGIGKVRVQLVASVVLGFISIPMSIFLCKLPFIGVNGVIVSNIFIMLVGTVLGPLQYYLIMSNKAKGIWLK